MKQIFKGFFIAWLALILMAADAAHAQDYSAVQLKDVEYSYQHSSKEKSDQEENCCGLIIVLAKATNTSDKALQNPTFEARLFDAQGKLVDAFTDTSYDLVLMPGQEVAVRIMDRARFGAERYARAQMRLVFGKFDHPDEENPSGPGLNIGQTVRDLLMAWGPVLLLIGVWLWLIKRSNGLHYQKEVLELMKSNNELQARQTAAIEKMAQISTQTSAQMRDPSQT